MLNFLSNENYEVHLLSPYSLNNPKIKEYKFKRRISFVEQGIIYLLRLYKISNIFLNINTITRNTINILKNNNYDLIICEDISIIHLVEKIKRNNTKAIFDMREYFTKQFDNMLSWRITKMEYHNYLLRKYKHCFNKFLTVSNGIAEEFKREYDIDAEVYMSLPLFSNHKSEIKNEYDKIKLVYHGIASPDRGIEMLIDVFKLLDDKLFSFDLFLVDILPNYIETLKNRAGNGINFHNSMKQNELITKLSLYDVGFYMLKPINFNINYALPNKLFEYIQAGLCLAFGPTYEIKYIIEKYKVGIVADNYDVKAIADKISKLSIKDINTFKNNSRKASEILNAERNNKRLKEIIEELIG